MPQKSIKRPRKIRQLLIRNTDGRGLIDAFLVAAVVSIFGVRLYLHLSGYPQIGHGAYHIAHMLWGGALMLVAMILALGFFGRRLQWWIAIVGGAGFGIFIDEVGKFITRDNNYFFQPSIGIIYAILVVIYLLSMLLERIRGITDEERKLNALRLLEDAVRHDLDPSEKAEIRELLGEVAHPDEVTRLLTKMLDQIDTIPQPPQTFIQRFNAMVRAKYIRFWKKRYTNGVVRTFFIMMIGVTVLALLSSVVVNIHSLDAFLSGHAPGTFFVRGQLIATGLSKVCLLAGLVTLTRNRANAFQWFYGATLINILLTQFFIFARFQFGALPYLLLQLILLGLTQVVISQERIQRKSRA